jgi:hypothetical protein
MTNSSSRLAFAAACAVLFGSERLSLAQVPVTEIILCGNIVPQTLREANASFYLTYEIQTNGLGRPTRITKLKNELLLDSALVACLQKWILPAADAKVVVLMRWEHAKGWTQFNISMPGRTSTQISINPGWPF